MAEFGSPRQGTFLFLVRRDQGEARTPFLVVMGLLVISILAVVLGYGAIARYQSESLKTRIQGLLQDGNRLLADGFLQEAETRYGTILAWDSDHAEAQIGMAFAAYQRGALDRESLALDVERFLTSEPPGFSELVRAELAVLDGQTDAAHLLFENALARGDDRLCFEVLHRVDHLKDWAATPFFCLAVRFPIIEQGGLALSRFTFRPSKPAYLTLFLCTASQGAELVFPRAGRPDDGLHPGGEALLVELYRDSGEWIFLSDDGETFLLGLATERVPDRDAIQQRLGEMVRDGQGKTEALALLAKEFGEDRVLVVAPQ